MNTFFCLEFLRDLPAALDWLRLSEGGRVLALRPEVEAELSRCAVPFVSLQTITLSSQDRQEMDSLSRELGRNWATLVRPGSVGDFFGADLSGFYELQMTADFFWVLRQIAMLDRFFTDNPTAEIAFVDRAARISLPDQRTVLKEILLEFKNRHGFRVRRIPVSPSGVNAEQKKRISLKGSIRRALCRVSRHLNPVDAGNRLVVLFSGSFKILDALIRTLPNMRATPVILRPHYERQCLVYLLRDRIASFSFEEELVTRKMAPFGQRASFMVVGESWAQESLFRGIRLSPIARELVTFVVEKRYPALLEKLFQMRRFLETRRVERVVVDEDVTEFNKAVVLAAKSLGIKSFVCQHGLPGDPVGFTPLTADMFISWGAQSSDKLRSWGVDGAHIAQLGASHYDELVKKNRPPRNRKGFAHRQTFLFVLPKLRSFASPGRSSNEHVTLGYLETILGALTIAMKKFPKARLLVKPHPFERPLEPLRSAFGRHCSGIRWNFAKNTGRASDLMIGCALVIGVESGAMAEALLLGIPSICLNFSGKPFVYDLVKHGVSLGAESPESLAERLSYALSDEYLSEFKKKRQELVSLYFSNSNGSASARAAEFILSPLSQKDPRPATAMTGAAHVQA